MRHVLAVSVVFGLLLLAASTGRADDLYTPTFSRTLVHVETVDASATAIGTSTIRATGAAFDVDGTLYTTCWIGVQQLATFDLETGAVIPVGPLPSLGPMDALEIDASGELYGVTRYGHAYRIDKSTGASTWLCSVGILGIGDLALDPDGNLWAVTSNRLYLLDVQTGASQYLGTITGAEGFVGGIAFDAAGRLWATSSGLDVLLYEVDLDTLSVGTVGHTGVDYPRGCDIYVPPVARELPPDADGDGVLDDVDAFPYSDLRPTVWVGDRDTGVENVLFDDGATIADLVADCAQGATRRGTYVSRVAQLCSALRADGWITGAEHGAIQRAAAQYFQ